MAKTAAIAKQLDDALYLPDFADLFVLEGVCAKVEGAHDLEDPAVIAALATCADLGPVQKRLIARSAKALAAGLANPPATLRPTAAILVQTLRAAAERELVAGAPAKPRTKRPTFAVPERLPVLLRGKTAVSTADTDALLDQLATGREVDTEAFTPASRAAFGHALVFGWLAHTGDPKARWAATAAAAFLDDGGAAAVADFAAGIASRTGQSSKAVALVEILGACSTRGALTALAALPKRVTARAVQTAANTALQQIAKRLDITEHALADQLMGVEGTIDAKAFARRLEHRMLAGTPMPMREFVESILQSASARAAAASLVFSTAKATFAIVDDHLETAAGKPFEPPSSAEIRVAYISDLSDADRTAWRKRFPDQPFAQLDRFVPAIPNLTALRELGNRFNHLKRLASDLFALEPLGWKRGPVKAGKCTSLVRELGGLSVKIHFRPGLSARTAAKQRLSKVLVDGTKPSTAALRQITRELELLGGPFLVAAKKRA